MDTLAPATLDAHGLSTREINERLRELLDGGAGTVDVLHPGSRHSLAVGFLDHPGAAVRFRGDVGYFCGGLSDGLDIAVDGNAGWSLGADMMDGSIVVGGNSGSSTGASMRGGLVVVRGDAGARSAIAGKGGTLVIGGSTGYMSGLHEPAHAAGGVRRRRAGVRRLDVRGRALLRRPHRRAGLRHGLRATVRARSWPWLADLCGTHGLAPAGEWQKVRSAGKLWRYDKKEFSIWRDAL